MRVVSIVMIAAGIAGTVSVTARAEDTVQSLLANNDRLNQVLAQCHQDWEKTGDQLCRTASQAQRIQFQGNGNIYHPHPVHMFPPNPPALQVVKPSTPPAPAKTSPSPE